VRVRRSCESVRSCVRFCADLMILIWWSSIEGLHIFSWHAVACFDVLHLNVKFECYGSSARELIRRTFGDSSDFRRFAGLSDIRRTFGDSPDFRTFVIFECYGSSARELIRENFWMLFLNVMSPSYINRMRYIVCYKYKSDFEYIFSHG
jgi:hypothetical protein